MEINSVKVYSSPVKLQVIVFAEEDSFQKLLEPLQDVARKFKSKILFIYIDISDENLAKPFLTLYGIEESKDTVVTAFDKLMFIHKLLFPLSPLLDVKSQFALASFILFFKELFEHYVVMESWEASVNYICRSS
ncbi:protein disulfide isomerase-like 1-6 [Morus notabilis]|uniref:protein disulfide isomerase-like 1-6 n=1 Tax=Morus notabilis TaxID=981085 RepID=UPI000CECF2B1|nr:protein disulfide isomerase-like 1-6 [Morus notabilis]XP_024031479.1 protein disulfide isomerase-like 1-6 [Morus notabilis]